MKTNDKNNKRKIKNDIILVVCLLLVAAIGMLYLFVFRAEGNTVKVTLDGKTYGVYSLSENRTEDIYTGQNNEHHNRLVIKDGKAHMETSTCPDGICVDHSAIFRDGESIVCLPHRIIVTIITSRNSDNPDI